MSNCVFNFNILALVLFGILGGSQIYIRGPCAPRRPPSVKILKCTQVLAYIYIIVNFQLRSSIHAVLTERSLCNRFALKNLRKWVFWGILGGGAKIFGGNPPRNAMTADLRRLVKKNMEMLCNTLVCTCGKEIQKKTKNGMSTPWGLHFTPAQCLLL